MYTRDDAAAELRRRYRLSKPVREAFLTLAREFGQVRVHWAEPVPGSSDPAAELGSDLVVWTGKSSGETTYDHGLFEYDAPF